MYQGEIHFATRHNQTAEPPLVVPGARAASLAIIRTKRQSAPSARQVRPPEIHAHRTKKAAADYGGARGPRREAERSGGRRGQRTSPTSKASGPSASGGARCARATNLDAHARAVAQTSRKGGPTGPDSKDHKRARAAVPGHRHAALSFRSRTRRPRAKAGSGLGAPSQHPREPRDGARMARAVHREHSVPARARRPWGRRLGLDARARLNDHLVCRASLVLRAWT